MTDLKKLAALTAINNMLAGGHFNICAIDSVAEMMGIPRNGSEAYQTLRTLHCIDYAKMPVELRNAIPGLIEQVLGVQPAYQFSVLGARVIEMQPAPPAHREAPESRGVLRLLGIGKRGAA
jgi:hypothetical protein